VKNEAAKQILELQLLQSDTSPKDKEELKRVLAVLTDYSPKLAR
jgi:hypothetical protein